MVSDLINALLRSLGILVLLEALWFVLRRAVPRLRLGFLFHLWTLVVVLASAEEITDWATSGGIAWKVVASALVVLTLLVIFSLIEQLILARRTATGSALLPKLARDVLRVALLVAAGLVIARVIFGQPLSALVVSSATALAVVGFALQDVLKNVFAGMTLQLEHPFQRGDWLHYQNVPSEVVDMTFRAVHLRTTEGVTVVVPNAQISGDPIRNLGSGSEPVAMSFYVSLPYAVPPQVVKEALREAVRSTPAIVETPASEVFLDSFGDSGVLYRVRAWTTWQRQLTRYQDQVLTRIWYRLQREGIEIPYPTRTLHFHNQDRGDSQRIQRDQERASTLFATLPVFEELPAMALRLLAALARRRHYDIGEVLVREGESGDSLFLIERGSVRVTKAGAPGQAELELAILTVGDFFGERSLLTGEPRGATVRAIEGVEAVILDRQAMAPVLANDPRLATTLSSALAAREAATAARVEDRRSAVRHAAAETESTFLRKIRSFFSLPETD